MLLDGNNAGNAIGICAGGVERDHGICERAAVLVRDAKVDAHHGSRREEQPAGYR
ncbi:MAG: hypothetical protein AAFX58_09490 [Pseudomonadota bacterium]